MTISHAPRLIIKTHTEGLRPGLFSLIIEQCTHPDQRSLAEHVARRASEKLLAELGLKREAAAKFAVFAAWRHFQFLQKNMAWDWRGETVHAVLGHAGRHTVSSVADYSRLSQPERALYLKYFLEADGAFILSFARRIGSGASREQLLDSLTSLVQGLYEEYIGAAQDFQDKVHIKERLSEIRKQTKGTEYQRGTLPHKVVPHLEAMEELGLITSSRVGNETWYHPSETEKGDALTALLSDIPDVMALEQAFDMGNPFRSVGRTLGLPFRPYESTRDDAALRATVSAGYNALKRAPTGMASLRAIADWTCVMMLVELQVLVSPREVLDRVDQMRRETPGRVRFHVDYAGNKAYVIMTSDA